MIKPIVIKKSVVHTQPKQPKKSLTFEQKKARVERKKRKRQNSVGYWKWKAHQVMDMTWKSGLMTRSQMYAMLRREMRTDVHISECGIEQCKQIIALFNPELLEKDL